MLPATTRAMWFGEGSRPRPRRSYDTRKASRRLDLPCVPLAQVWDRPRPNCREADPHRSIRPRSHPSRERELPHFRPARFRLLVETEGPQGSLQVVQDGRGKRQSEPKWRYGLNEINAAVSGENCATTPSMRCYFLRGGHIEAVEELTGLSDDEAVAKAHILFSERSDLFDGFEVWDRRRVIIRRPPIDQGLEGAD